MTAVEEACRQSGLALEVKGCHQAAVTDEVRFVHKKERKCWQEEVEKLSL